MRKVIQRIIYSYNHMNPTSKDENVSLYAPAFRGENELNIYTFDYELKTKKNLTGTNPWGIEASVNEKGVVIDKNDRVIIPKNGFVISGNSLGSQFIKEHVFIGSQIKILTDTKQIEVITNILKSDYLTFKKQQKEIKRRYNYAILHAYRLDLTKIKKHFEKIQTIEKELKKYLSLTLINEKQYQYFKRLLKNANDSFDLLYLLTSPSTRIEARYAWMRPFEQNLNEILHTLNICKKCHINGIFVESFYNGDIPGISNITSTNDEVKNGYYGPIYQKDYLKAFINEAHRLKIEVHAWVECFFVGERHTQWKKSYKDDWHMVNYDGSTIQGNNEEHNEEDFIWLDPANPECLKYVLSIYKELLTNYEFDGINVDYVRYPHGNLNLSSSNGYTNYAMNEFKKIYQLDGDVKELVKNNDIHELWVQYRCNKITLLMQNIRQLVNQIRPSCKISTAVCSDVHYAMYNKMQNWKVWAKKGWLDLTLPMAYYTGCSEIATATKELVHFNHKNAFSYTGILCYQNDQSEILFIKQINTLFQNHAEGYALFQLEDVLSHPKIQRYLRLSTNKVSSIVPHSSTIKILNAFILELKERKSFFKDSIDGLINHLILIRKLNTKDIILSLKSIKNRYNKVLQKEILKIINILSINEKLKQHTHL